MVLLFVYGTLRQGEEPPERYEFVSEDAIVGELYDLGDFLAAVDIGYLGGRIDGEVLDVPEEDLEELDKREWGYRRVWTKTLAGRDVQVYEYQGLVPSTVEPEVAWENGLNAVHPSFLSSVISQALTKAVIEKEMRCAITPDDYMELAREFDIGRDYDAFPHLDSRALVHRRIERAYLDWLYSTDWYRRFKERRRERLLGPSALHPLFVMVPFEKIKVGDLIRIDSYYKRLSHQPCIMNYGVIAWKGPLDFRDVVMAGLEEAPCPRCDNALEISGANFYCGRCNIEIESRIILQSFKKLGDRYTLWAIWSNTPDGAKKGIENAEQYPLEYKSRLTWERGKDSAIMRIADRKILERGIPVPDVRWPTGGDMP